MHLEDRPDLIEKSIPDYPAMGKRILQDNGSWLRTLKKPNVELVHTGIERIVPDGVVTVDGALHDADVICYATGFRHNDFLASMEVTGRNGVSLRDQWGDEPTAYLGIAIPNFPNLFCMYGPGTNLAHGASLFFHSECQIHYAMDCIHRVLASGAQTIEVRKDAHDEYVERYRARDRPARVVTPVDRAQPLQEPAGQDLHAVAVAARAVLGMDAIGRPRAVRRRLSPRTDLDRKKFWT